MHSLKDEIRHLFSGTGVFYPKLSLYVAVSIAIVFTLCFSNRFISEADIAVIDLDHSRHSRAFIDKLDASPYMRVNAVLHAATEPETLFYNGKHLAVIYLPNGFEKNKYAEDSNPIGVFYDNTNLSQSANIQEALNSIVTAENSNIDSGQEARALSLNRRQLFNPLGSYTNTMGIGFLFFFSSVFFTLAVIGIVPRLRLEKKWEQELLSGNPLATVSRLVPYAVFFLIANTVGLLILRLFNDLSIQGSFLLFLPAMLLLAVSLGIFAMLAGWGAPNPIAAGQKLLLVVTPGYLFSGMMIPVDFFPLWVQFVTHLFPLRWFYKLVKDILLRGTALGDCAAEYGGYMLFTGVLLACFSARFFLQRIRLLQNVTSETDELHPVLRKSGARVQ